MGLKSLGGMRHIRLLGRGRLTTRLRIVAWLLRIVVGATFVFSGFTKMVDPYGTIYKISDYISVWGWNLPQSLVVIAAFMLFTTEFAIGLMLMFGCFRRTSALCATLVMAFMLPLSLWLAVDNPVAECGCFGDALVISNWSTFWKNIGLTAACVWLLFFNRRVHWVITPALQWIALTLSIAYCGFCGFIGYEVQPPFDFRSFPVGSRLGIADDTDGDVSQQVRLIYRNNDGTEKSFGLEEELPDEASGWTFIRQEVMKDNTTPATTGEGLHIWSVDGEDDVTSEVLQAEGNQLILFMPSLSHVNLRDTWDVNSLYRYSTDLGVNMVAVCAATPEAISIWEDLSLSEYPIYTAEDTAIKEIVRGNPALVYLEQGQIKWKQTLKSIDVDELTSPDTKEDLQNLPLDTQAVVKYASTLFGIVICVLILASFLPPSVITVRLLRRRRRIRFYLRKRLKSKRIPQ